MTAYGAIAEGGETAWCAGCGSRVPSVDLDWCKGTNRCGRDRMGNLEKLANPPTSETRDD
jgi:hypothetical protein